jgi:predicted double-glycine peptidase
MSVQGILFVAVLVLTAAAGPLGWWVGARSKRTATLAAGSVCLLLGVGAFLGYHPALFPEWLLDRVVVLLQQSWFAPPAVFLFALSIRQARDRERTGTAPGPLRWRRKAVLLSAFGVIVCANAGYSLLASYGWKSWVRDVPRVQRDASGRPQPQITEDNVVLQSTGYTCGASSCATLLRRTGIDPNATEADLVPRVLTRRWDGATLLGMAAGLRESAEPAGWRVKVFEPDWDTFKSLRKPLLCSVRLSKSITHAVVVTEIDPHKGVRVADPLRGLSWWSESNFRARFLNDAVVVYKQDPFEPVAARTSPLDPFRVPKQIVW